MKDYKGHTSIHVFFEPFTKKMIYKSINNRFPLSGRKIKKLTEKLKAEYPDVKRVWINVHYPNGAHNWAFRGMPATKQSVEITL